MGLLNSILKRGESATTTAADATSTALDRAGDVVARTGSSLSRTGSMIADRATTYYKANPKKVQALGLLAAAALLVGIKNRGRI
jgi:hypothetical protein